MSKKVDFYFDLGSPTAYLAYKQLMKFKAQYGAEIVFEPMLLGAVHKATNNLSPIMVPAKGKHMLVQDLPRFVKRYNVEFKMNPHFPINTLQLMRGCYAAMEMGCFETYVDAMFDALWAKGKDMAKPEVVTEVLSDADIDADKLFTLIAQDEIKEKLKVNTAKSIEIGCFGAPSMFIDGEMFFGQDRLDFVEARLTED